MQRGRRRHAHSDALLRLPILNTRQLVIGAEVVKMASISLLAAVVYLLLLSITSACQILHSSPHLMTHRQNSLNYHRIAKYDGAKGPNKASLSSTIPFSSLQELTLEQLFAPVKRYPASAITQQQQQQQHQQQQQQQQYYPQMSHHHQPLKVTFFCAEGMYFRTKVHGNNLASLPHIYIAVFVCEQHITMGGTCVVASSEQKVIRKLHL